MNGCLICGSIGNCIHKGQMMVEITQAPIVKQSENETVFQGSGNSHFSHVKDQGFHVTTQVPGIPGGISIHDLIKPE